MTGPSTAWWIAAAFFLLAASEVAIRVSGIVDFPIYRTDERIGYLLYPNQAGRFLRKNRWVFNGRSMPIETEWPVDGKRSVLLVGNSVFMGGNPYDQPDKVGPLLQSMVDPSISIWPIAVGGWTNVNEAAFLEANPDLVDSTSMFVWECMSGGFGELARWHGECTFPTRHPIWATGYVLRRHVLPKFIRFDESELPPKGEPKDKNIERFKNQIQRLSKASGRSVPGLLLLYPTERELDLARSGKSWMPERDELEIIAREYGLKILDLSSAPEWNSEHYRDGIHPTQEGNQMLARLLASEIQRELNQEPSRQRWLPS